VPDYPNVNGEEYSYASITLKLDGTRYYGATAINYDDGLTPGRSKGTGTLPGGSTAGEWDGTSSIEFNLRDGQEILDDFGDGYGRVKFGVVVQFAEEGMPVITHELPKVRIQKVTNANSQGTDASKMTFELHLMAPILRNGVAIERALEQ
jgi:hypothetical protein